jgi:hypothetical protein
MRRITAVLTLVLAAVAAAILAAPSGSHNVVTPQPAWFKVTVKAAQTGDAAEFLRGSVQGHGTEFAGYIRVKATVENVGTTSHTGKVVLTVAHPTGELTKVLAVKVKLAPTSEFLRAAPRTRCRPRSRSQQPCPVTAPGRTW